MFGCVGVCVCVSVWVCNCLWYLLYQKWLALISRFHLCTRNGHSNILIKIDQHDGSSNISIVNQARVNKTWKQFEKLWKTTVYKLQKLPLLQTEAMGQAQKEDSGKQPILPLHPALVTFPNTVEATNCYCFSSTHLLFLLCSSGTSTGLKRELLALDEVALYYFNVCNRHDQ